MASFDAGSIESRLTLDRTEFTRGIQEAKREVQKFERDRHEIKLKADTSDVSRAIAGVKSELASLRNVSLNIGVRGSGTGQIQAMRAQMAGLRDQTVGLGVSVSGVGMATNQLNVLQRQVNRLDGRMITIHADVDTRNAADSIAALRRQLNDLNDTNARVTGSNNTTTRSFGGMRGMMSGLITQAVLLAPALFPLTAAALSAAAAFTTMAVAGASAAGVFGIAMFGAITKVTGLNEELGKAKKALDSQRKALELLEPGTDAYAKQLEKVEVAQKAVTAAQNAFTPEQKRFVSATDQMKAAWSDFIDATDNSTLPVASTALLAVKEALPQLVPAAHATAVEFQAIAHAMRAWVRDGGLERFVGWIQGTGVPVFKNWRLTVVNLATVMGNMFRAFSPQARGMAASMTVLTASMARWSNEGGFERFIGRVQKNAPQVREFFRALWDALVNIGNAIRPLGPLSLGYATILLKLVAALPPEWIQAVVLGFAAWKAVMLGMMIIKVITTLVIGLRAAWVWLNVAFAMSPIGFIITLVVALIAVIVLIATKTTWFQQAWAFAWKYISVYASSVWNSTLKPAFDGIWWGLQKIGQGAMWLWRNAIKPAFDGISFAARLLVVIIGTILITPVYLLLKLFGAQAMWLWKVAIGPAFRGIASLAGWLWREGLKPVFGLAKLGIQGLGIIFKWLWNNAVKPTFAKIQLGAAIWWASVKIFFGYVSGALRTVGGWAKWLWNKGVKPSFNAIAGGAKWLWERGIRPPVNFVVGGFKKMGSWASWLWRKGVKPHWDSMKKGTNLLRLAMVGTFEKMKNGIGKIWKALKKIAAVPINFVIREVYNKGVVKVWNKIAGAVGLDKMKLDNVSQIKYAEGGAVKNGIAGMDSVDIKAMPGEHIWTAEEVKNAGGHNAMAALRSQFSSTGKARVAPGAPRSGSRHDFARGSGTRYAWGGGVIDWAKDSLGDVAKSAKGAWDATGGKVVSKAWSKLGQVVRGGIGAVANPVLKSIKGGVRGGINGLIPGSPPWQKLAAGTATRPIDMLMDWINKDDAKHAMIGGGNVAGALSWAKRQEGKPYVWGGVGPRGYDCSGFMSAIQNVIMGKNPHSRQWATGAFPPGAKGWKRNKKSPFTVGITNAGVGHTAGTLNGVNVESRGGAGVVVGKGARGTKSGMFSSEWGFTPAIQSGGSGKWSETVSAVLRELGMYSGGNLANVLRAIQKESGGNPRAVNNWDSNARAGIPSKGLLQTIGPTFNAYAGKYRGKGIYDPYANIYAAIRYAKSRYGGGWSSRMARPGGYADGGVTTPGLHMVGENGPELVATGGNSRVFTAQETQRMLRVANSGGSSGEVKVITLPDRMVIKIGEREFLAMLDDETRAILDDVISDAVGER